MPCAPMPLVEDTLKDIAVNSRVVTALTGFQSYYRRRTLMMPRLIRKAAFWGGGPPAVNNEVLQFKRLIPRPITS